jgi:hypothetical protein
MNQHQWVSATEPQAMLAFLRGTGRVSERKLRLWGVACCRSAWGLLTDARSCRAVELAELYADGAAPEVELQAALAGARRAYENALLTEDGAAFAVVCMASGDYQGAAARVAEALPQPEREAGRRRQA